MGSPLASLTPLSPDKETPPQPGQASHALGAAPQTSPRLNV